MPFFLTQRASRSFCRKRSGLSAHPSGSWPRLIASFSGREFRCYCCAEALRLGNRDQCGINDLPATGLQPLGAQVLIKPFKKLIDDTRLADPFAEESNGGGIGMVFITPREALGNKVASVAWAAQMFGLDVLGTVKWRFVWISSFLVHFPCHFGFILATMGTPLVRSCPA